MSDGVAVETRPGLGRVLVATRAFDFGDVVLEEPALLFWRRDRAVGGPQRHEAFLHAFAAAPDATQRAVLDFARPALDTRSPLCDALRAEAKALAGTCGLSEERIVDLLFIDATNTHGYFGAQGDVGASCLIESTDAEPPFSAMFDLGSKVAHSCAPNTLYTTRFGRGLRYTAVRSIASREQVTFSYIAGTTDGRLSSTPRSERRARLAATKHFLCRCSRCAGPDECRPLRCAAAPPCGGVCLRDDDADDGAGGLALGTGLWRCLACEASFGDASMQPRLADEALLARRVAALTASLEAGEPLRAGPPAFTTLAAEVRAKLAPTHYLAAKVLQLGATWGASQRRPMEQAAAVMRRPPGSPIPSPWGGVTSASIISGWASQMGADSIVVSECAASKCCVGLAARCATAHPPLPDCMMPALFAGQDAREAGDASHVRHLVPRYAPLLRLRFGDADAAVRAFEALAGAANGEGAAPAAPRLARCALPSCRALEPAPQAWRVCGRCQRATYCGAKHAADDWARHKREDACKAAKAAT